MRQWRVENKERQKASFRKYYLEHRKQHLEAGRVYAAEHPEIVARAKAKYVLAHRDRVRESRRRSAKEYRKNHPEQKRLQKQTRRARQKGVQIDLRLIRQWMAEVRTKPFVRCHWCGTKIRGQRIHFDHIIALANQGTHTIGNLCCACDDCNLKKSARAISDWIVNGQRFLL